MGMATQSPRCLQRAVFSAGFIWCPLQLISFELESEGNCQSRYSLLTPMNMQDWAGTEGCKSSALPDQDATGAPESISRSTGLLRTPPIWISYGPLIVSPLQQRSGAAYWRTIRMQWSLPLLLSHSWLFWWSSRVFLSYLLGYPSFRIQKGLMSIVRKAGNRLTSWVKGKPGLKEETKTQVFFVRQRQKDHASLQVIMEPWVTKRSRA